MKVLLILCLIGAAAADSWSGSFNVNANAQVSLSSSTTGASLMGASDKDGQFIISGSYTDPTSSNGMTNMICIYGSVGPDGLWSGYGVNGDSSAMFSAKSVPTTVSVSSGSFTMSGEMSDVVLTKNEDKIQGIPQQLCGMYSYTSSNSSGYASETASVNYNGYFGNYTVSVSVSKSRSSGGTVPNAPETISGSSSISMYDMNPSPYGNPTSISGCFSSVEAYGSSFMARGHISGSPLTVSGRMIGGMFITDSVSTSFGTEGSPALPAFSGSYYPAPPTPEGSEPSPGSFTIQPLNTGASYGQMISGMLYPNGTVATTMIPNSNLAGTYDKETGMFTLSGLYDNRKVDMSGQMGSSCVYTEQVTVSCPTQEEMKSMGEARVVNGESSFAIGCGMATEPSFSLSGYYFGSGAATQFDISGVYHPGDMMTGTMGNVTDLVINVDTQTVSGYTITGMSSSMGSGSNMVSGSIEKDGANVGSFSVSSYWGTIGVQYLTIN